MPTPGYLSTILIALAVARTSAAIIFPRDSTQVVAPRTAVFSASVLHTARTNRLQAQIDSIPACQVLRIDSVRVLDTQLDTGIQFVNLNSPPERDLRVWWSLWQTPSDASCAQSRASRHMIEIPSPSVRPGSDTLLTRWAPRRIEALGPDSRRDTVTPARINQAGIYDTDECFVVDYKCVRELTIGQTLEERFVGMIHEQLQTGLPVVRISRAGALRRTPIPLRGAYSLDYLGPNPSWGRGNQAWIEDIPLKSSRIWGYVPAPAEWSRTTGRFFYLWRNSPLPRCGNNDSLCLVDSERSWVTSNGPDLLVSNDSTTYCGFPYPIDWKADADLATDWLILPDSIEARSGAFRRTLRRNPCGGRYNAWPIRNDSVLFDGTPVALSVLDQTLAVSRRAAAPTFACRPTETGLLVRTGLEPGEAWSARVLDLSGRILSSAASRSPELDLTLGARGTFLVEIRTAQGRQVRSIVR